jgi:hypothetical protein
VKPAHQPWLKWYPADWRSDPRLRDCSLAARGLWVELLGLMHEADPYGHLVIAGNAPTLQKLASHVGATVAAVRSALDELDRAGVFSRDDVGRIYSRRMVRDRAKAERDRDNGMGGGNPSLKPVVNVGVNPQDNREDKAQKPEARSHKLQRQKQDQVAASPLPPWLPTEVWEVWKRHRGRKLKAETIVMQIAKLDTLRKNGHDPAQVIGQSIERGWSGLFEVKATSPPKGATTGERRAASIAELTGRAKNERAIDGTAERMGSAAIPAVPGDLREPRGDDVGRRTA